MDLAAAQVASTTISSVPAYDWRHGCGPTAAGMVIGYWDGQGYGALVPGDAYTQTTAVDTMIASGNSDLDLGTNFSDYCFPVEYSFTDPPCPTNPSRHPATSTPTTAWPTI